MIGLEAIDSVELTAPATTVSFTDIPQTYKALHIRLSGQTTYQAANSTGDLQFRLNSFTTGYNNYRTYGDSSTQYQQLLRNAAYGQIGFMTTSTAPTGYLSPVSLIANFFDYNTNQNKMILSRYETAYGSTNARVGFGVSVLEQTAAITSIEFFQSVGGYAWATGTTIGLYGWVG